jgi:hypothetical protein
MNRNAWILAGVFMLFVFVVPTAHAINITIATISAGDVVVEGNQAARAATITWEGQVVTKANNGGAFKFSTSNLPSDCVGELSDGVTTIQVVVNGCTISQGGGVLATGQTTAYTADKNDGISGPVSVPDDGTLQRGAPLQYVDNSDGTVTDLNTGLQWEMKVAGSGCLHCVNDTYPWSGNGSQETIWDWLDDVNAEGGTGFTGHNDWRIPNLRELHSIFELREI